MNVLCVSALTSAAHLQKILSLLLRLFNFQERFNA